MYCASMCKRGIHLTGLAIVIQLGLVKNFLWLTLASQKLQTKDGITYSVYFINDLKDIDNICEPKKVILQGK